MQSVTSLFFTFLVAVLGLIFDSCSNNSTASKLEQARALQDTIPKYVGKTPDVYAAMGADCEDWKQKVYQEIPSIFTRLDTISSIQWNYCYGVSDCQIEGKAKFNGKVFNYSLNAFGWAIISNEETQIFLGVRYNSPEAEFFLDTSFCDQQGNLRE